ncbi:NACHT domain-containing protein [Fusarium falciforme]|uniref:NACHT domain-containing protein n=1 Tax=Fusarium falciforme TaxID=195108 RepID=UPI0023013929|nr:NACHT domain-containing protein [Fusarium falciforme]WAO89136.1 NACHT domain-containing protein [Fusarium falciforme]
MRCLSPGAMSSEAPANIAINIGNVNLGPRATAILGMDSICSDSKAQEKTIKQCKDALFVSEPSSVRAELLNIKGNLTEGTCQWIRRNLEGLLDSDNEFFHGKEGMLIRSRWWDAYGEPVPSNFKKAGNLYPLAHTVLARCQVDATDFNGWTPMWSSAGPGTVSAMKQAAAILQKNNVKVEKVSLPPEVAGVEALGRIQRAITHVEA